jgi:thiol:disulfide interchange protein DsbA
MFKKLARYFWVLLLFPVIALAANKGVPPFQAGQDYQVTPAVAATSEVSAGKIQMIEFFSYGCPACYHFEPALEAWLKKKPKDVVFERVPVTFEPGWDKLARVYYTAKNLGVAEKLAPAIFASIQKQRLDFTNEAVLTQFFVAHGVSKQDFASMYHFSPGIDAQMMRGDNLMKTYQIFQVPTVLINGKYKTNPAMAGGRNERFLQIIDYLIAKERQENKK